MRKIFREYVMATKGFECTMSFYDDFTEAEKQGAVAISKAYTKAIRRCKHDVKAMTELLITLQYLEYYSWKYGFEHITKAYERQQMRMVRYAAKELSDVGYETIRKYAFYL